ncbi:HmuY family protein [Parafilimonas sp.]|uniref:HmuY family protein n=1 Tax=Parafilimonas sp. TaxID=1969739 RepID=UPI0039E4803F
MRKTANRFLFIALTALFTNCKKDDPALPDNLVQFSTSQLGFESDSSSIEISLSLSRATSADVPIVISLAGDGVTYGTEFTTTPAASGGNISLTIPAGSSSTSFTITKTTGVLLDGDESVSFAITSAGTPILIGSTDSLELSFSAIISQGSKLTLNGGDGGAAAENTVFVDFSANQQTAVKRDSWDLGFYSGDEYRVILNYMLSGAMAVQIDKNDLTQVTAEDTAGMVLSQTYSPSDLAKVDDYTGDLSNTVIDEISATDADNKVYILNRSGLVAGTSNGWVKLRVLRNSSGGYTLQYADIADAAFNTVDIAKDDTYQFSYVSLESGTAVSVAPAKGCWDIEWGLASYYTSSGASNIYYPFSDLVFINNMDGTEAAEVLTSTVTYDAFDESSLASVTFSSDRDVIGSNWRATTGSSVGVKTDRFYVVKDPAGNIYKLKFLNFTTQDGGTRGYPNIEYALVQ